MTDGNSVTLTVTTNSTGLSCNHPKYVKHIFKFIVLQKQILKNMVLLIEMEDLAYFFLNIVKNSTYYVEIELRDALVLKL